MPPGGQCEGGSPTERTDLLLRSIGGLGLGEAARPFICVFPFSKRELREAKMNTVV